MTVAEADIGCALILVVFVVVWPWIALGIWRYIKFVERVIGR